MAAGRFGQPPSKVSAGAKGTAYKIGNAIQHVGLTGGHKRLVPFIAQTVKGGKTDTEDQQLHPCQAIGPRMMAGSTKQSGQQAISSHVKHFVFQRKVRAGIGGRETGLHEDCEA